MTKTVATLADIETLQDGEAFIADPGGLPDDPEELINGPGWQAVEKLLKAAEQKFEPRKPGTPGNQGVNANNRSRNGR